MIKEKLAALREKDKAKVSKTLLNFYNLKENDEYILKSLTEEPFYNILLNKILTTDYSTNSGLLASSLIFFF